MVQFSALLPFGSRRLSTATVGRIGRGWSFHLIGFWNPGRMSHPRPGTFSLQIRVARTPQTAQGHHLAVAKYDVL